MKKHTRTAELFWVCGILFVALGVAVCSKAGLGVSMIAAPTFVVHDAAVRLFPALSVGVTEYILQGVILLLLCLAIGRINWKFLFTFASAVIYGYTLDLFVWLIGAEPFSSVPVRWVMLVVGDAVTSLGVACFFRTYLPLQVHELFVAQFAKRYGLRINRVKWTYDLSMLAVSLILAFVLFDDFAFARLADSNYHMLGLGTLVTTVINSPMIAGFGKLLDRLGPPEPALPALRGFFED